MSGAITIDNLKGIKHLRFDVPNASGVYLLVGENGSGKTTLLACLHRICNSYAFADNFPKSSNGSNVDQYKDAQIQYECDDGSVIYRKGEKKWNPFPRKGSRTLSGFGFPASIFAKVDSGRLSVKKDDLDSGSLHEPTPFLQSALRKVFGDPRFEDLKILKTKNGRRWFNDYFVVEDGDGSMYSEKRFSTGELAVLRLLSRLEKALNHSLVLLDEVELAIHPKVQRKLLDFLREQAEAKSLTIVVATHSQTLISNEDPRNIILLKKNDEEIAVTNPCYPAQAMQCIDVFNSVLGDYLVFVEDEMAMHCFKAMCRRVVNSGEIGREILCPVLPVAGYKETAELALNFVDKAPDYTKVLAVVDEDAFEDGRRDFLDLANKHKETIFSLGYTPEVKLVELISMRLNEFDDFCRTRFSKSVQEVLESDSFVEIDAEGERKKAKRQFNYVVESISPTSGSTRVTEKELIDELIGYMDMGTIKGIICPMFR